MSDFDRVKQLLSELDEIFQRDSDLHYRIVSPAAFHIGRKFYGDRFHERADEVMATTNEIFRLAMGLKGFKT